MAEHFLLYHLIFSTKNREPWIRHGIGDRVWSYLGGVGRDKGIKPLKIGGMPDHIHIALALPTSMAVCEAAKLIKGASSKWMKDTFPGMKGFGWQDGYGAFTVSRSNLGEVICYIEKQREHHCIKTFQEEYRAFLEKHEVDFDEEYLLGLIPAHFMRRYATPEVAANMIRGINSTATERVVAPRLTRNS